jgi:hypothetical protein
MIPVKGFTTFHPLKHCIVGRAHDPKDVDDPLKKIMEDTNEDLNELVDKLTSAGVVCYRPRVEKKDSRPPISPRDYFIAIGQNLLVGKVIAGYKDILSKIDRKQIKWYLGNDISSGNMVRCGNHVHWDISKDVRPESEKTIKNWLHENGYKVSFTRYGWHMDGVYSILKPGVIVATRDLPELEEIYPGWDICYLDRIKKYKPIKHTWGGNHEESNYDVNILSIDENTCFTTAVNDVMFRFLRKHSIEPVVCELRHKAFWDNGIHCMTQDLYREGILEDYF